MSSMSDDPVAMQLFDEQRATQAAIDARREQAQLAQAQAIVSEAATPKSTLRTPDLWAIENDRYTVERVFADELEALRVINERGYGKVIPLMYGMSALESAAWLAE